MPDKLPKGLRLVIEQIFSAFMTFSSSAQKVGSGDGVSILQTANSIWVLRKEGEWNWSVEGLRE